MYTYMCIYVYMYIHTYVYMYTYSYTYIHHVYICTLHVQMDVVGASSLSYTHINIRHIYTFMNIYTSYIYVMHMYMCIYLARAEGGGRSQQRFVTVQFVGRRHKRGGSPSTSRISPLLKCVCV